MGRRVFRKCYKGPMDKTKGVGGSKGEGGFGWYGVSGMEKMQTSVTEQQ